MSTRGIIGVYINGESKLTFNHFDSYPEGLGVDVFADVLGMLNEWGIEKMQRMARRLTLVTSETPFTDEVVEEFRHFTKDFDRELKDWDDVLEGLQGHLMDTLVAGYAANDNSFIADSLFCEWGYVLNLDDNLLEVYRGFQTEPHSKGRYASIPVERGAAGHLYYPCALHIAFPLDKLPEMDEIDYLIEIRRAGFNSDEDIVMDRFKNYGELTTQDAALLYGIYNLPEVVANLEKTGAEIKFDGNEYSLTRA